MGPTKSNKISKKIILAKQAGFCFGVKRAVEMAEKALSGKNGRVFCLGEIIHNPQVILRLEKMGLITIFDLKRLKKGDTLLIRSHGVSPEIIKKVQEKGAIIIDATCPFVKKAQQVAADFEKKGRQVIIFGDPKHPEVIGIKGHAPRSLVIQSNKEIKKFKKIGLLAQTTQKPDLFQKISDKVKKISPDSRIANTICLDSFNKKQEVEKIARKVDVMIIVGGKKSNNTKKLAEVSRKTGTRTHHIETASEIKRAWFEGTKSIGISAGASTPEESIEGVIKKINSLF